MAQCSCQWLSAVACGSEQLPVAQCSCQWLSAVACGSVQLPVAQCSCLWLRAVACGSVQLPVAQCSCLWLRAVACGSVQLPVAQCSCLWLRAVACGSEQLPVAQCSCQWLSAVACGSEQLPVAQCSCQWLSAVACGSEQLPVAQCSCQWLSAVAYGSVQLPVAQCSCQWLCAVASGSVQLPVAQCFAVSLCVGIARGTMSNSFSELIVWSAVLAVWMFLLVYLHTTFIPLPLPFQGIPQVVNGDPHLSEILIMWETSAACKTSTSRRYTLESKCYHVHTYHQNGLRASLVDLTSLIRPQGYQVKSSDGTTITVSICKPLVATSSSATCNGSMACARRGKGQEVVLLGAWSEDKEMQLHMHNGLLSVQYSMKNVSEDCGTESSTTHTRNVRIHFICPKEDQVGGWV